MEDDSKQNNATKKQLKVQKKIFLEMEDDLKKCNLKQLKVKTKIVAPLRVT
jgi:hypothetical protein